MTRVLGAMFLVGVLALGAGCTRKVPDEWKGFYYDRAGNEVNRIYVGTYSTLNHCLDMSRAVAGEGNAYHCGYGCQQAVDGTENCERVMGSQ